ncbi:hypothetical protein V8C86DRAFT_2450684 [Haematococcus lacustris]
MGRLALLDTWALALGLALTKSLVVAGQTASANLPCCSQVPQKSSGTRTMKAVLKNCGRFGCIAVAMRVAMFTPLLLRCSSGIII